MALLGQGLHQTAIGKIETNARQTSAQELYALAVIFGVPIGDLFDQSDSAYYRYQLEEAWADRARAKEHLDEAQKRFGHYDSVFRQGMGRAAGFGIDLEKALPGFVAGDF